MDGATKVVFEVGELAKRKRNSGQNRNKKISIKYRLKATTSGWSAIIIPHKYLA